MRSQRDMSILPRLIPGAVYVKFAPLLADKAEVTGTDERRVVDVFAAPAHLSESSAAATTPAASTAGGDSKVTGKVLGNAEAASAPVPPEAEAVSPSKQVVPPGAPAPAPAPAPLPAPAVDDASLEVDPLPEEQPPAGDLATPRGIDAAVVMTVVAKATVRSGPQLTAPPIGDLRIGQTVQVLEEAEHDGHARVRIASSPDGSQAWCSRRTPTRALLEVADSSTPIPGPFVRKKPTRPKPMNQDVRGAAVKGALLGASEAVVRNSLNKSDEQSPQSAGGGGNEFAGAPQLEAKLAAAKAARAEATAAAAAKRTFQYRLTEAVRNPPRSLVVGLGSLFAGAVLGPGYISWRCSTLELQSQLACETAKEETLATAVDAGDAMVNAPLLLCFLLSLGYLTNRETDATNGGGSSPNGALATMASMGAGGDQRQMQRLIEGGTSVMSGLASIKNMTDDAAGEFTPARYTCVVIVPVLYLCLTGDECSRSCALRFPGRFVGVLGLSSGK